MECLRLYFVGLHVLSLSSWRIRICVESVWFHGRLCICSIPEPKDTTARCSTRLYSIYVLCVLLLTYLVNQLDRYLLGIVTKPMSQELEYGDIACMRNDSVAQNDAVCNATDVYEYVCICHSSCLLSICVPCGLQGCKNWPALFPSQMSYKATKPGLALSGVYLSMFYCTVVY